MTENGQLVKAGADLAKSAREAARQALELEQLSLLDEPAFEEALLMPAEEVRKRYTAENARQIEWRREACVKLLARDVATEDIADILSMNHRTVSAIAAQEGRKIAAFSEVQSEFLAQDAMSDLAVARTKREAASYKDLHIAAGIKLTHAVALKMVGAGAGDMSDGALDVEADDPKRAAFVERLKKLELEIKT